MQVKIKSASGEMNYLCENDRGQHIVLSGSKNGVSPMESLLMAGAACSTIDIEMILKKAKQKYTYIEVVVDGERAQDETPAVFKKVHLHYVIYGIVKEEKAKIAVALSIEKYCSVLKMVEKTASISYSFEIAS
jgi:putative redox protein